MVTAGDCEALRDNTRECEPDLETGAGKIAEILRGKSESVTIPYHFSPRNYQKPFFFAMNSGIKRAIKIWHRRTGKDKTDLNYLISQMFSRVGSYYYFLPTLAQGRLAIWDGIGSDGFKFIDHIPAQFITKKRDDEMKITLSNNSQFQVLGTDNIDNKMGSNCVGAVFSEYSLQIPRAWDLIRPILAENDGWAIFNFTPRGRNHAYQLVLSVCNILGIPFEALYTNPNGFGGRGWFIQLLTADMTKRPDGSPVVSEEVIQSERESGMDESTIQQEFYCSFDAQLSACFFGESLRRHLNTVVPGECGYLTEDSNRTIGWLQDDNGVIEIWRHPYYLNPKWDSIPWQSRYTIGTDISEGLGLDYSVAYVYDRLTHEFVARMRSNEIDSVTWADMLITLSRYYSSSSTASKRLHDEPALIVPERNGAGITTCKRLQDEGANLYYQMQPAQAGSKPGKRAGWLETRQAKHDLCGDLKAYFEHDAQAVYDRFLLDECSVFIMRRDNSGNITGEIGGERGFNDDCVIAAGLALQGSYFLGGKPEMIKPQETGWRVDIRKEETGWAL